MHPGEEEHYRRLDAALARHDLCEAEWSLLGIAGHRIDLSPRAFVNSAWNHGKHDREPLPTLDELGAALTRLLERGLLTVLGEEDARREAERRSASTIPELDEGFHRPGDVDFTPEGYRVHRALVLEVFGEEHARYNDSGFFLDEPSRCFTVVAETRALCLQRIEEIQEDPESVASEGLAEVVEVGIPQPIGAWKPVRFSVVERGFRATVRVGPRTD